MPGIVLGEHLLPATTQGGRHYCLHLGSDQTQVGPTHSACQQTPLSFLGFFFLFIVMPLYPLDGGVTGLLPTSPLHWPSHALASLVSYVDIHLASQEVYRIIASLCPVGLAL